MLGLVRVALLVVVYVLKSELLVKQKRFHTSIER